MLSKTSTPKKRRQAFSSGVTATLLLTLTACVVSPEDGSTPRPEDTGTLESNPPDEQGGDTEGNPIAHAATTTTPLGQDLEIGVVALERLESEALRLRLQVSNKSTESISLFDGLSEPNDPNTASLVSLVDASNQKRYLSYDQSNGQCFCSPPLEGPIPAGESEEIWVIYPEPPDDLEQMTVVVPLAPPIMDVPISDSTERMDNISLADAQILNLTMISDNLEDQTGRTESGEEVSIILSSDVLFETNSSDLNSEAEEILEQVALEIDDSSATTVKIDGHADNTGSDATNVPLSEERAESVKEALADLLTRSGIDFEVAGHGSSDPIADNSTEEGRERNRRVSVTFEK
ncbi:OmpA family protein [Nocardiopsis sp. NPDC057823]|uniref:OmpA family protein n=1 Tax=Nocardiopsis sp. NPDC057823 TaxID=3346256 RepID=UPI003671AB07